MLSVPIASLVWSVLRFMMVVSAYCLQRMGTETGRKVLFGLEIGVFVSAFPFALIFFSVGWKEEEEKAIV
jgi:hypothetical protein